jgi:uncharacterized phage protein (TIGR01671 family)
MRGIKFRAWDKKYKYMNYKVVVGNTDENDENYTAHAMWIDPKKVDYECEPHWCNFDESGASFMQYTGLKDKNGIEIYEGDIVRFKHDTSFRGGGFSRKQFKAAVIYEASEGIGGAKFSTRFKDDLGDPSRRDIDRYSNEEIEVIGNIHQHSHLLEDAT